MCSLAQVCKRGRPTLGDALITLVEALFKKAYPKNRSFSGPQRGFSHGPPYRPPMRPPVRRNIATNPYVRPRSRLNRNDNRDFNNFTPPSGNFTPHPPASEDRYYQKFSQAPPNKMKSPTVLDYRMNEKDVQTNNKPPVGCYPEWQKDSPPCKKGQMVCFSVVVCSFYAAIPPMLHQK